MRGGSLTDVRSCVGGDDLIAFHASTEARKSATRTTRTTSNSRDARACEIIGLASRPLAEFNAVSIETTSCQLSTAARLNCTQFL